MTVTKYKTADGTVLYRAEVMVNGYRKGKRGFTRLGDAINWQDDMRQAMKSGASSEEEVPVEQKDMLFIEASDRAIVESRVHVTSGQIKNYQFAQAQFIRSFGESATLQSISKADVTAHMLRRTNNDMVGVSIIRTELAFLRSVYTKAASWGIEITSPELTIKRPRQKTKGREEGLDRVIKSDELVAIMAEAKKRRNNLYQYLLFLLYTGMRPSEAACLYWDRLPAKEEKEAIKKKLPVGYVDLERGGFSKVGTKTTARFVPAHPVVVELIKSIEQPKGKKLVFLPDSFIGADRAYLHFRRTLETTLRNAKIDGRPLRGDINFYSFRHTFRSALEEAGVSTAIAETIIGHAETGGFKFTYIHVSDEKLIEAVGRILFDL